VTALNDHDSLLLPNRHGLDLPNHKIHQNNKSVNLRLEIIPLTNVRFCWNKLYLGETSASLQHGSVIDLSKAKALDRWRLRTEEGFPLGNLLFSTRYNL